MKLILKRRVLNGKNLGGYYTKLNSRTYNIVKGYLGGWDVVGCPINSEQYSHIVATGCKSLGWAETAIIESVSRIDRETTWIEAA